MKPLAHERSGPWHAVYPWRPRYRGQCAYCATQFMSDYDHVVVREHVQWCSDGCRGRYDRLRAEQAQRDHEGAILDRQSRNVVAS